MKKLLLLISSLFITNCMTAQCVAITGFTVTPPSCNGLSNGVIVVDYTSGVAPYTITWSSPISQTVVTSALSQSVTGIASGVYTATVTDNNGCSSSQPVNVSSPPSLSLFTVPDATICYGQSAQIAAAGTGGTPPYTYTWTPTPFVGGGPHTVSPTTTMTYTVDMSDVNGCSTSAKIITVNVTPPLLVFANSVYICDGAATALVPNIVSPGSGGPYTYNWSTSATTNSIVVIGSVPFGASSTTTYTLVVDDGCTMPGAAAIFTVNAVLCLGIEELNNSSILFYPNPTNGLVRIETYEEFQSVEVIDITGKLLLSEKVNTTSYILQIEHVNEGIYFVKLKFKDGRTITKKIIKQ